MNKDLPYSTEGVGEFVLPLFPKEFKGVCIDVGAYHPKWRSNSYVFGLAGWAVFYLEPNPNCAHHFSESDKLYQYAIGLENKDDVDYFIFSPSDEASWTGLYNYPVTLDTVVGVTKAKQRTLDWFLTHVTDVPQVDYISIDVEGKEFDVLRSIDLDRWGVKVIVVENFCSGNFYHFLDGRKGDEVEKYLTGYGFELIKKIQINEIYQRVT